MTTQTQQQPGRAGGGPSPSSGMAANWISSSPFPTKHTDRDYADMDELSERLRQTWIPSGPSTPSPSSSSNAASPSSTTRVHPNGGVGGPSPMDAFLQSHSRVVKVLGLPGGTTQDELVRWIVRDRSAGAGGVRGVFGSGEAAGWWVVFDDHSTARNSLRLSSSYFGDYQVAISPALEQDLISEARLVGMPDFGSSQNYQTPPLTPSHPPHTRNSSITSSMGSGSPLASRSQLWALSPLNPQQQHLQQQEYQHQQEQDQWSAASGYGGLLGLGLGLGVGGGQGMDALTGLGLGTGSVTFRSGDWICPSDNCSFHNFSRNDRCGSCGAAKPSGSTGSHPRHHRTPSISPTQTFSSLPGTYASIHAPVNAGMHGRTVSGPAAPPSHMQQQRGLATSASNPDFFGTGTGRGLPFPSGQVFGAGPAGGSLGLTGLGGDAAGNGRTRSISYAGGGMSGLGRAAAQPGMIPILNTGNQGVMVVQPGDWACGDCGFVNWRRRTCCLRCYPHASGNESNGLSLAQSAQLAAQLAALPSFTPQSAPAQHSALSPIANGGSAPSLNRSNSTPSAPNSHLNLGLGSPPSAPNGGTGRPTFISSGPYRPSVPTPTRETDVKRPSPVQTDVFGHVVHAGAANGQKQTQAQAQQQQQRQRIASMPAANGGAAR